MSALRKFKFHCIREGPALQNKQRASGDEKEKKSRPRNTTAKASSPRNLDRRRGGGRAAYVVTQPPLSRTFGSVANSLLPPCLTCHVFSLDPKSKETPRWQRTGPGSFCPTGLSASVLAACSPQDEKIPRDDNIVPAASRLVCGDPFRLPRGREGWPMRAYSPPRVSIAVTLDVPLRTW